jgi:hypothetical protein
MEAKELYKIIEKNSLPHMSAYQTDLTKIDREAIEAMPKLYGKLVPFVHITRDWGTHLDEFWPVESYPKPGEMVPYLFGSVDRYALVERAGSTVQYYTERKAEQSAIKLIQYFDGVKVKNISLEQAMAMFLQYRRMVQNAWNKEKYHPIGWNDVIQKIEESDKAWSEIVS